PGGEHHRVARLHPEPAHGAAEAAGADGADAQPGAGSLREHALGAREQDEPQRTGGQHDATRAVVTGTTVRKDRADMALGAAHRDLLMLRICARSWCAAIAGATERAFAPPGDTPSVVSEWAPASPHTIDASPRSESMS